MKRAVLGALALLAVLGMIVWREQLFTVSRPGVRPMALALKSAELRAPVSVDVVLPAVPAGLQRVRGGGDVLLIHYWAPWERHSRAQAADLDSLRREADLDRLRVVVVCFDPFPSVARYVARHRLRLNVLLDGEHQLRRALPCPSMPYTYVIDREGRIAVAQPGEVDWWDRETRQALRAVLEEVATTPQVVQPS